MSQTEPAIPDFVHAAINLADARLGAVAIDASDEFFAPKERMLDPQPAVFVAGKYDDHGKWMDGWETRRRRGPGHDWCIVRLARPGRIDGIDLDTSHFTGNYPPAAALEGCLLTRGDPDERTVWTPLLPAVPLQGDRHHYHPISDRSSYSHLRLHLYPDGGVARLRVYGRPDFDPGHHGDDGLIDLAAGIHGGRAIAANNQHYGVIGNLLLPGRGRDMGDGWETRRRREPGNDWCILALATAGIIEVVELDTAHFKGNYPDRFSLQAALVEESSEASLIAQAMFWPTLLPEQPLSADSIHRFDAVTRLGPVSHVRLNIFPDGGVSRLRLLGRPA